MSKTSSRFGFSVKILGGFAVFRTDAPVSLRPSVRRLVALLAVEGRQERGDAAARLFEDSSDARSQSNLRTILWRLHKDCPGLLSEDGGSLRLRIDSLDYDEVERWSRAVIQRSATLPPVPDRAGKELLPSWGEPWLVEPREHLRMMQLHALEENAERMLLAVRFGEAFDCALRATFLDPLRESATRILIEVMIRQGNVAGALAWYNRFAQRLQRDVNAEPGIALRSLVAPLLAAGCVSPAPLRTSR